MKWLITKNNSTKTQGVYEKILILPSSGKIRICGVAYLSGWGRFNLINSQGLVIWTPKSKGNSENVDFKIEGEESIRFYGVDPGAGFTGEKIMDLNIYTDKELDYFDNSSKELVSTKKSSNWKYLLIFLLGIILLFLFFSCSTRKKTVTKESVKTIYDTLTKRDSIFIEKETVVLLPSINTDVISYPCDSTGKLKIIEKIIKIPYGEVRVNSEGENLKIKVNTDSINTVYERLYHEQNEKQLQRITELQKENTTLKITPFNWWKVAFWISIGINVIFIFLLLKRKLWI